MRNIDVGIISLLLVSFVLYVFVIDLSLFYQLQQPLFNNDLSYFINLFSLPEGLALYLGEFLTERLNNKYIGAFTIVGFQVLFILPFYLLVRKRKEVFVLITNILSLLFLSLFLNYALKLESVITLMFSLWLSLVLNYILAKGAKLIITYLSIVFYLLFAYWLGGGASLLFAGLLAIVIVFQSQHKLQHQLAQIALVIIFCVSVPYFSLVTQIHGVDLKTAYFGSLIADVNYQISLSYYVFIGSLLLLFAMSLNSKLSIEIKSDYLNYINISGAIFLVVLTLIFLEGESKQKLLNERYLENKEWGKYMDGADNLDSPTILDAFYINRAMFHLGLFLDEGNHYAQQYADKALLIEHKIDRNRFMPSSDIYWELGYINESRHWAHEAFTSFGYQPRILKRLVEVNIILGKFNTANKYIALLKKSPLHREWAVEKEGYLYDSKKCEATPYYNEKIQGLPNKDFYASRSSGRANLVNLLDNSNENNMVLEYLAMTYLLRHDLGRLMEILPLFKAHNYSSLPKLVQQAILVYSADTGFSQVNLFGFTIDDHEIVRYKVYTQLYASYNRGVSDSKEKINAKFADTYWYYIHFGSPLNQDKK